MRSDEEILAAVGRGDERALSELYDRHALALLRYLTRLAGGRTSPEDLLQETWLAIWRSAGSFRGESSARSWLFGVAHRQAHNHLRGRTYHQVELTDDLGLSSDAPQPPEIAERREGLAALEDAISRLHPRLIEVLHLVLVEDLPYSDIAKALGLPPGTVKSRMSQARTQLRTLLAPPTQEAAR